MTPCYADIEEAMTITPGEGRKLISVLADEYCEEMAHPHLLPCCKYDYKTERDIDLHSVCCR